MTFSAKITNILETLLLTSEVITATSLREKEMGGRATFTAYFQTCLRVLIKVFSPVEMH